MSNLVVDLVGVYVIMEIDSYQNRRILDLDRFIFLRFRIQKNRLVIIIAFRLDAISIHLTLCIKQKKKKQYNFF